MLSGTSTSKEERGSNKFDEEEELASPDPIRPPVFTTVGKNSGLNHDSVTSVLQSPVVKDRDLRIHTEMQMPGVCFKIIQEGKKS